MPESITAGYIRVSTKEQNESRQIEEMKRLGVHEDYMFIDKQSGKDFEREQYQEMKKRLRKGDLLYIDELNRLGRHYDLIIQEWKYFTREKGIDIVILEKKDLFDSRKFRDMGDYGKVMEDQFLSMYAYFAEKERETMLRRQRQGIEAAKKAGKHLGRKKITWDTLSVTQKKVLENNFDRWKNKEITGVKFAEMLELKKNTFYNIMKEYEKKIS